MTSGGSWTYQLSPTLDMSHINSRMDPAMRDATDTTYFTHPWEAQLGKLTDGKQINVPSKEQDWTSMCTDPEKAKKAGAPKIVLFASAIALHR